MENRALFYFWAYLYKLYSLYFIYSKEKGEEMPKVKDGKVSLNLKLSEEMYNRWVDKACEMRITNMSEFIRLMVEKEINNESSR